MTNFPLKVDTVGEPANSVGLFDAYGYWVTIGCGHLEMPLAHRALMEKIAKLANAAYDVGRSAAYRDLREMIGISDE